MYDNNIKLLGLTTLKDKIESIDIRCVDGKLIAEIKLNQVIKSCPVCSSYRLKLNCYKIKKISHSISTQNPCLIHLKHRRFQCQNCLKTFFEDNPFVESKSNVGYLTKLSIIEYLKDYNHTFTDAAKHFNTSIQTAFNIFDRHISAVRRFLPEVVCIDEVFTSKMNRYKYACILFDFKSSKIIDVLANRHKNYLVEYFSRIPVTEKANVKVVVMDMWDSYREAVKLCFPNALIAVDSFHIIKNLNETIKSIRINIQAKYRQNKTTLEGNDMYYYMLKKFHYFFVKNYDKIYDGKIHIHKLNAYWYKSEILKYLLSIDDRLAAAYKLKERYREFNLTADVHTAKEQLSDLITEFRNSELEGYRSFGKMLANWKDEIINSFISVDNRRVSNGPIESTNSNIKTIIKTACGVRKFERFKNRVMFSVNKDIPIKN